MGVNVYFKPFIMPSLPPVASSIVAFEPEDSKTLIQTVLALLNTYGGDLYIGVTSSREVIGVTPPVELQTRHVDMFRENVYPSAFPYLAFSIETFEDHSVLRLHVDRGDGRPYRLAHDDVSSVFVRVGASNSLATEQQIAQFVREANPIPWAKRQSKDQALTFEALDLWTSARHIALDLHDAALGFGLL